jgi:hypothetical protein
MRSQQPPRARLLALVVLVAGFTLVVAVVTAGCGGSSGTTTTSGTTSTTVAPTTSSTEAETTTTTAAKLAWGGTGTWQGIDITVSEPREDSQPESVDPGDKVVYCMVKMVNDSKDPVDYNGLDFIMYDTDHQQYDNFGLTSMPDFGEGTLAPGDSVWKAVAFEMPSAATPSGMEWQPQTADAPQLIWGQP